MKNFVKIFGITFIIIVAGVLFCLSHQIGGFRTFIVSSSSMTPTIETGTLVVTQTGNPKTLKKGDIITFTAPIAKPEFVTHRIVEVKEKNNLLVFKTKGDNNQHPDTWTLSEGGVVGKVTFSIPLLGYVFTFTQTKPGMLLFILVPAVFIIVEEIKIIFHLIKTHKNKMIY